jgi:predicted acyl esterase
MIAERDIEIPMADGIALAADVFRPAGGPPAPVIMSTGPYGKGVHSRDSHPAEWHRLLTQHPEVLDGSPGEHMAWELPDPERRVPAGYAVVRADSRSAGRSPGDESPYSARTLHRTGPSAPRCHAAALLASAGNNRR